LRNSSPALRRGDLTLVDAPDGVLAYRRVAGEDRKFVALNLTAEPRQVAARGTVLISTAGVREPADGSLALGPGEGVVLDEGPL
jgi:alpha-glucosidase